MWLFPGPKSRIRQEPSVLLNPYGSGWNWMVALVKLGRSEGVIPFAKTFLLKYVACLDFFCSCNLQSEFSKYLLNLLQNYRQICRFDKNLPHLSYLKLIRNGIRLEHGLRTPNEGINQRYLKKLGRCGRQNMLRPYLKIWEWEWIFVRAVKAISSPGVRSPWFDASLDTEILRSI